METPTRRHDQAAMDPLTVELLGVQLQFIPGGALFHPDTASVLVADLHLGKDATFRKNGLAVPSGTNEATLQQLSQILESTEASRLVLLGDLIHDRSSLDSSVVDAFAEFCRIHADVEITLIRGNHDRISRFPNRWRLGERSAGTLLGRIELHHEPVEPTEGSLAVAGHLHPSYRVRSRQESLGRMPCYWLHRGCLVLPALGRFTGTHTVKPRRNDRVWVDAKGSIIEIPLTSRSNGNG
ncbi:MAG: ligase-associated DNA damage response endonuclease PdeM [Planctomycetota bacterium]